MKVWLAIATFIAIHFQQKNDLSDIEFLVGTWKVDGMEQYEFWETNIDGELSGYSYNLKNGSMKKTEILTIKMQNSQIVYEATVPNQNQGRTIPFVLNPEIKSCFSFENPAHDFPKKIQYEKKSEDEILIRVLGDENKGFSYVLIRK